MQQQQEQNQREQRRGFRSYSFLRRDPVKLTALLYLKEALLEERYEECAEIIKIAKEFGATFNEVYTLLEDARRMPTA